MRKLERELKPERRGAAAANDRAERMAAAYADLRAAVRRNEMLVVTTKERRAAAGVDNIDEVSRMRRLDFPGGEQHCAGRCARSGADHRN
jgi:hypothetical protein